jgi:hypothetical protein
MNPKPLVALNHFTVPVATSALPVETTEQSWALAQAAASKNPPA